MSEELHKKLIDQLSEKLSITKGDSVYQRLPLNVQGVDCLIVNGSPTAPDSVFFYADCGLPDDQLKLKILQRLLEINLVCYNDRPASYGFDADSGHVTLMCFEPLAECTLESILELLSNMAHTASEWRKTYFLLAEERNLKQDHSDQ